MKVGRALLMVFVVLTLVAVTPALAAGGGNQAGNQNGQRSQGENQEKSQGGSQNQEQNQNREQNGQPEALPGKQIFALTGTITALDAASITVLVHNGNRFAKPYIGMDLMVLLTEDTGYWAYTPGGCIPISLEDLEVGDSASVKGMVIDDTFSAQRVTVDVPCCSP